MDTCPSTCNAAERRVYMKRAAWLFITAFLMFYLLFFIKSDMQNNMSDKYVTSAAVQVPSRSLDVSGITSVSFPSSPSVLMRGQTLTQELSDLLEEKNIKNPLFAAVFVVLFHFLSLRGRDVLCLFLSVYLIFSCSLMNQVCIIHRSDGKKRAVFF